MMNMMGRLSLKHLSQDTILAIAFLLISGGLMIASFDIREPDYGQLSPAAWPRAVIAALGFLSFLYLLQSLRGTVSTVSEKLQDAITGQPGGKAPPEAMAVFGTDEVQVQPGGALAFLRYWRNVIWCFVLFLIYLLTMPYLGMLIGGVSFAFLLMTALGGYQPRQLMMHAAIAILCVGGVWALFTFGLKVPLPPGQILPRF